MKREKSLGYGGLPVEYCKVFADVVVPVLQRIYQEIFEKGHVPPIFNKVVISLIPQTGKDAADASNFRPINLLNLDCKVLTEILATYLHLVLLSIIHPSQVGVMKNRI